MAVDDGFKITINTRNVSDGDVFFCFQNAEKYLTSDIFPKISKLYCEVGFLDRIKDSRLGDKIKKYDKKINEIKDLKLELIKQLKLKYKQSDNIIAVTGTKGKTSTAWFTMQMVGYCGVKCGYIGTIGVYLFDGNEIKKVNQGYTLTTPDIDEFYRYIDVLKQNGANVVVFEASSHALSQGRIDGLKINCGCFTNFSQDHLDYHGTMDNYFLSKSLLFSKYLQSNGIAIINDTDEKANSLKRICIQRNIVVKTIGNTDENDIKIFSIKQSKKGQEIEFYVKDCNTQNYKFFSFCTNILGEFQIFNLLEATLICSSVLNINYNTLCSLMFKICPPIGRMQRIKNTNVFVDFAHTPKSLEESIRLLKSRYKKVVVVFGCGGNRDKQKRPIMCEIARKMADFAVITSDNPRFEKPENIIKDITCFIDKDKSNPLYNDDYVKNEINKIDNSRKDDNSEYKVIVSRSKAIFFAVSKFYNEDECAILIAGKGHEDYQIMGDEKIHFSDSEEAELALLKTKAGRKNKNIK